MTLLLGAKPVHAQGTWVPNWVAVDANGIPTYDWSFYGTPTGQATITYDQKWKAMGFPSYPFSPDPYSSPNFYGNGPFSRSKTFVVSTAAYNGILNNGARVVTADQGSVTVNEQGDYTLTLMWAPIYQGPPPTPALPPPPKSINLLINVGGGGGAFVSPGTAAYPSTATASAQISDSLGDSGSYSVGTTGSQGPYRHLVTVSGSTITKTIHMTGTSTASDMDGRSVTYSTMGYGNASYTASASLDSRSVVLFRGVGDINDGNGTFEGDTTYSYTDSITGVTNPVYHVNSQSLTAARQGYWSPDSTLNYSWSPSNGVDNINSGTVQMGYGNVEYVDGEAQGKHDNPATYHVTYTCTDPLDGATAKGQYIFHVHDQWDNMTADPVTPTTPNDRYDYLLSAAGIKLGVENPAGSKGPVKGHWTFTITVGFSLGLNLSSSFKLSDVYTFGISFNPSVSGSFGLSLGTDSPDIDPGYESFPYVHTHWLTRHYLFDHYSPGGKDTGPSLGGHYPQAIDDHSTLASTVGWSVEQKIGQPT